jgi:hypothetical protein
MTLDMQQEEVNQVIHESGLIEDNLNLTNTDDLLLLDVVDSTSQSVIERRRHQRFRVNICAFALIRSAAANPIKIHGQGMGQIACSVFRSKPAKLGQIINISMGGLMFRYVDCRVQSDESIAMDILSADCGFYLENLRFKSISDLPVPNDFLNGPLKMGQLHAEFERPAPYQMARLRYFISYCRREVKC